MLTAYLEAAMRRAQYQRFDDEQPPYFGIIFELPCVWAAGKTKEACEIALRNGLEHWLIEQLRTDDVPPPLDGINLSQTTPPANPAPVPSTELDEQLDAIINSGGDWHEQRQAHEDFERKHYYDPDPAAAFARARRAHHALLDGTASYW